MLQRFASFLSVLLIASCATIDGGASKVGEAVVTDQANATPGTVDNRPPIEAELQSLYKRGVSLMKSGEFSEAVEHWKTVAESYPSYPGVWLNLGLSQQNLENFEDAVDSYRSAASADPQYCLAYSSMGPAFRELGRFVEAEEAYLNAIYCDPDDPDPHYNLGILYDLYMQNPMGALEEYKVANGLLNGKDELLPIWIGDLSRRLGVPEEPVETAPTVVEQSESGNGFENDEQSVEETVENTGVSESETMENPENSEPVMEQTTDTEQQEVADGASGNENSTLTEDTVPEESEKNPSEVEQKIEGGVE